MLGLMALIGTASPSGIIADDGLMSGLGELDFASRLVMIRRFGSLRKVKSSAVVFRFTPALVDVELYIFPNSDLFISASSISP